MINYTDKEIELALDYIKGNINDVQLNFISVQGKIDLDKVKNAAQEIKELTNIFMISFVAIIFFIGCLIIKFFV